MEGCWRKTPRWDRLPAWYLFGAMVGTARCAVPARVVAGGRNDRVASAIRKSCAAARGADIAARCPYHAKQIPSLSGPKRVEMAEEKGRASILCGRIRGAARRKFRPRKELDESAALKREGQL